MRPSVPGTLHSKAESGARLVSVSQSSINLGSVKTPNYAAALAIFSLGAFLAVIIFTAIGREARGIEFITSDEEEQQAEVAAERMGRRLA